MWRMTLEGYIPIQLRLDILEMLCHQPFWMGVRTSQLMSHGQGERCVSACATVELGLAGLAMELSADLPAFHKYKFVPVFCSSVLYLKSSHVLIFGNSRHTKDMFGWKGLRLYSSRQITVVRSRNTAPNLNPFKGYLCKTTLSDTVCVSCLYKFSVDCWFMLIPLL